MKFTWVVMRLIKDVQHLSLSNGEGVGPKDSFGEGEAQMLSRDQNDERSVATDDDKRTRSWTNRKIKNQNIITDVRRDLHSRLTTHDI